MTGPAATPAFQQAQRLHRAGQLAEAERLYRAALDSHPADPHAARALAVLLRQTRRDPDAVAVLERALGSNPADAAIRGELALAQEAVGRADDALANLVRATALDPANPAAQFHLGRLYLVRGEPWKAVRPLRRAIELNPANPEFRRALGAAMLNSGHGDKAVPHFEAALAASPESPELRCMLAAACAAAGDPGRALALYSEVLRARPDHPVALAGAAQIHESAGREAESAAILGPAIAAGTPDPAVAMAFARIAKRLDRLEEALAALRRALEGPKVRRHQRMELFFVAGKTLEDLKRYDEAFGSYRDGHALAPRTFDKVVYKAGIDELIRAFDAAAFAGLPRATNRSEAPVFIVGMPRSGTTLAEQIISSHPAAFGAGELPDIDRIVRTLPAGLGSAHAYPACLASARPDALESVAREHLDRLASLGGSAQRVCDKMPHNFRHLGAIAILFPGARIIHCTRDAVDTCLSCYTTALNATHDYTHDPDDLAFAYAQYRRLMDHWRSVLPVSLLDIAYEEVVDDQEGMTRRMLEFLGLPWDEACLRFHESGRVVTTASRDQVRRPIYRTSVARAARFGSNLDPLREALRAYLPEPGERAPGSA